MTTQILALLMGTAGGSMGQFPQQPQTPLQKPVISPYLNLLRRGGTPAFNYFTLVQPQLQAQQNLNNLQQQLTGLENTPQMGVYGGTGSDLSTGKQVGYFTHRAYFLTGGGGVGVARTLTGQQGGGTGNTVYAPPKPQSPISPSSVMPYRR